MTPQRFSKICQVLDKRQPDLTVITDEVHKPRNIAAIVRNCDAVGIDTMHCVVPRRGYQIFMGTSASAEKWVEMQHHECVETPLTALKAAGYQIVCAHVGTGARDYREVDYTGPTALLVGAEIDGISAVGLGFADHKVILPMVGMVESYNVSVATALILAEAFAQRQRAGHYARPRLPAALYHKRFMHWAHPKIAEYCDSRGIPYPELDDDGEVRDLSAWYQRTRTSTEVRLKE